MFRRPLIVAFGFLLLIVGGYSIYWWVAADQAERAVERWIDDWRKAGYTVDSGDQHLGGFPSLVTLDIDTPRLTDPEGVWHWSGERIRFEVRPWAPTDYRLELFGANQVTAPIDGRPTDFTLRAARAVGGAEVSLAGLLRRISLTFDDLVIDSRTLDLNAGAARLVATLDLPATPPQSADDLSAELMLTGDDMRLPERHAGPLGQEVKWLSTRLIMRGPMPQAGLRQSLQVWRDAGGRLETPWLRIGWGPLGLDAEGGLSLDQDLRPQGLYQARISGFEGAIQRFSDAGMIDPTAARLLAGGARLFAQSGSDGRDFIQMPLKAENGGLFLGPIRIARLAPVVPEPGRPAAAVPPPIAPAPPPGAVESEDLPAILEPPTVSPDFPSGD
jgi:hypothetical protein